MQNWKEVRGKLTSPHHFGVNQSLFVSRTDEGAASRSTDYGPTANNETMTDAVVSGLTGKLCMAPLYTPVARIAPMLWLLRPLLTAG